MTQESENEKENQQPAELSNMTYHHFLQLALDIDGIVIKTR